MIYLRCYAMALATLSAPLFLTRLSAQSDYGSIVGFVQATGQENPATTNESGHYVVASLPPGCYTLTASASGFKRFESSHNKLDSNSTLSLDATLTIGAVNETVEVIASATPLQTESAVVEKLVSRSQIDALELNGRDPIFMASLQPGIRSSSTLGDFNFNLTNGGYYINGARQEDTLITFYGAPATQRGPTIAPLAWPTWTPRRRYRFSRLICGRIRPRGRRTNPNHHQERRQGISW